MEPNNMDIYNTIIGTVSLVVGVLSLRFSIVGYKASKKASIEAEAAKQETADVKKLIERTNYVKETKLSFQEDLLTACKEENRIDKASKLLSILKRIRTRDKLWNGSEVENAISELNWAISHLDIEVSWAVGSNTKAMANAEGLAKAYIDQLGERITEITEEQLDKNSSS